MKALNDSKQLSELSATQARAKADSMAEEASRLTAQLIASESVITELRDRMDKSETEAGVNMQSLSFVHLSDFERSLETV